MTIDEKKEKCTAFFSKLHDLLSETHELVQSCNQDFSAYLIPNGTVAELTYYGKPDNSFRISDHWNWYSSKKKCDKLDEIQCYTPDMPWTRKRSTENPEGATKPIFGVQVGFYGMDHVYHCVYGERFNRNTKKWEWYDGDPKEAVKLIF